MLKTCPHCRAPYVESGVDPDKTCLKSAALRELIRYRPGCDCQEQAEQRELERQAAEKQRQRWRAEIESRYPPSRMPPRLRRRRFDNFIPTDEASKHALRVCRDFAAHFDCWRGREMNSLFLSGPPDRGKTHLAGAVYNALYEAGTILVGVNWANLLERCRNAFHQQTSSEERKPLLECECLVLDEVGAGPFHPWVSDLLYTILDHRLMWDRPTLCTSNLSVEELGRCYGDRIASRLIRGYRVLRL